MTSLFDVSPPTSKEEFVYEALKEAILSGQLKPGDALVQTDLAHSLGVSPIPVRSAISRLAAEGLVSQSPYRSPQVSELSPEGLQEILMIRMHLELVATREALPHVSPECLADLRSLVHEMGEALRKCEYHRYGGLNKAFHLRLYDACPYPMLKQMIRDLWDNSDRHRSRTMFVVLPELAQRSQQDHLRLLELIEAGDTDAAVALMSEHKTRAREQFVETLPVLAEKRSQER